MFGDIGHGFILFSVASFICWYGDKIDGLKSLYNVRYMLLLMGFFSFFCGLMYNDFMSLPLEVFKSWYNENAKGVTLQTDWVYPFGMDPKWYVAHILNFHNWTKIYSINYPNKGFWAYVLLMFWTYPLQKK